MVVSRIARGLLGAAVLTAGFMVPAAPAEAASNCVISGASRTCYELVDISKTTKVIEVVTVQTPKSSKKGVLSSCAFEQRFERNVAFSVSNGATVGVSAEATIMGLVKVAAKAEYNITVAATYSQSASTATSTVGQVMVDPGERLTCTRKNTQVTTTFIRTIETGTTQSISKVYVKGAPRNLVVVEHEVNDY
jgi:hypothetical protein